MSIERPRARKPPAAPAAASSSSSPSERPAEQVTPRKTSFPQPSAVEETPAAQSQLVSGVCKPLPRREKFTKKISEEKKSSYFKNKFRAFVTESSVSVRKTWEARKEDTLPTVPYRSASVLGALHSSPLHSPHPPLVTKNPAASFLLTIHGCPLCLLVKITILKT